MIASTHILGRVLGKPSERLRGDDPAMPFVDLILTADG